MSAKGFEYNWKPKLPGKHLLIISIYADDVLIKYIEKIIEVKTDVVIEDKLAEANLI